MGLSNYIKRYLSRNDRRVLVLGLEASGKTEFVRKIVASGKSISEIEEAGPSGDRFVIYTTRNGRMTYSFWELGGTDALRPYWRHYYAGAQAVVFVLDCAADRWKHAAAVSELKEIVKDAQLAGIPIVVALTKCETLSAEKLLTFRSELNIDSLFEAAIGRDWKVIETSGLSSDGIKQTVAFLADRSKPL